VWTSLLAVIAHPDYVSTGLGAVLDAFMLAGTTVEVLCLTHGQVWTLDGAPGDLAAMRGAELASPNDVLGAMRAKLPNHPEGALSLIPQSALTAQVVAAAELSHPDGLLVFDTAAVAGRPDHAAVTSATLLAAATLDLPVLGWTFDDSVAARLNQEPGAASTGGDIDLRVTLERARQRLASRIQEGRALPGSDLWRRLQLLADTGSLAWLRPPGL